ncbi:MAG TPA: GDSL-type esterase/lipase family protein [Rhodanobacteraceae bacterium]|nr:GDSL-type esterase/lipase family protein [Rhodanobacteraceae bacterium]
MGSLGAAGAPAAGFLALGDSYTIGEGVDADGRWPQQLVRRLAADGLAPDEPMIVARTGWATDELAQAMDQAVLRPPYALVTLQIGVNNQYRGRNLDDFRDQFYGLLERAIDLAGDEPRRVVVISIPDWGVTRFAHEQARDTARIAAEIDAFNATARAVTLAHRACWVDVTALSREAGADGAMLTGDGLHPSAAQYARWVQAIEPVAKAALGVR